MSFHGIIKLWINNFYKYNYYDENQQKNLKSFAEIHNNSLFFLEFFSVPKVNFILFFTIIDDAVVPKTVLTILDIR